MTVLLRLLNTVSGPRGPLLLLMMCFATFVALRLVPTNYGLELERVGVDPQVVIGHPRHVTGSEVERLTIIPSFQIQANNHFARFNSTSPFHEDMRSLYALPIKDYGIVFKPTLIWFLILPPALALSLHYALVYGLFLVGYALLFRRIGATPWTSAFLSGGLLFSAFLQFWFPYFGLSMALFPWVCLAAIWPRNPIVCLLAFAYAASAWLIANLYPPLVVSLGLVAVALYLNVLPWREAVRRLPGVVIGGALALGFILFYLGDAITAIKGTSYPGPRQVGGGGVPIAVWVGQFFPSLYAEGFRSLVGNDLAEIAGAGSPLFLAIIVFLDYRKMTTLTAGERWKVLILIVPLVAMWCWMLLPLPSWAGMPLGFNLVQGRRMFLACAVLMTVITLVVVLRLGLVLNVARVLHFLLAWPLLWFAFKYPHLEALSKTTLVRDFSFFFLVAGLGIAVLWVPAFLRHGFLILAAGAMIASFTSFGTIYPLQSAKPIFTRGDTDTLRAFQRMQQEHPEGLLVVPGETMSGSILNGLGFKSPAQSFLLPSTDFYQRFFPDLSKDEFTNIFNRQSIVRLFFIDRATAPGLGVNLPAFAFAPNPVRRCVVARPPSDHPIRWDGGNFTVSREATSHRILLDGWGRWAGLSDKQALFIVTSLQPEKQRFSIVSRPIGGNMLLSGFHVDLTFPPEADLAAIRVALAAQETDGALRWLDESDKALASQQ